MSFRSYLLSALIALPLSLTACSDDGGARDGRTESDGVSDGGSDVPRSDGQPRPDGPPPAEVLSCKNPPLVPPASGTCTGTKGQNSAILLRGTVLGAGKVFENGHLLIDEGKILCVGCDCSGQPAYAKANQITCAKAVISPALVNPHEHLGWSEVHPYLYRSDYNHRHEWRKGKDGKERVSTPGDATGREGKWWGELSHLLAGTVSIMGAGGADGLVRNLDMSFTGGLSGKAEAPTFPFGDSDGRLRTNNCDYKKMPSVDKVESALAYVPHVAEGINTAANNEYLCLSGQRSDGVDVSLGNATFIHAVALTANDAMEMAQSHTGVNWSPRSNVSLYGMTADVVMLRNIGIKLSLGTDWNYSGSLNLLRELACVNKLNDTYYGGAFSPRDLWRMVTANAADACGFGDRLGRLKPGFVADVAVFAAKDGQHFEAVTRGSVKEVALVMRGGELLYGDAAVMDAVGKLTKCEALDVCGEQRKLCLAQEIGMDLHGLKAAIVAKRKDKNQSPTEPYALFFCGKPTAEPSCTPARPGAYDGSITSDDLDGDGIKNAEDTCPAVFNPPRPMNAGKQPDTDADQVGDECDACPLDPHTVQCKTQFNPDDRDGDGFDNDIDNCPALANPDQKDGDKDDVGDVCDPCPQQPGTCPYSIKDIRNPQNSKRPVDGSRVKVVGVTVIGVRTAKANNYGFYVREGKGDYEAIFVFTRDQQPKDKGGVPLKVGDVVEFEATFDIFSSVDELVDPSGVIVSGQGDASPLDVKTKHLIPGTVATDMLESQLVRVAGAKVQGPVIGASSDSYWISDDGSSCTGGTVSCAKVSDFFFDGGVKDGKPALVLGSTIGLVGIVNGFRNDHSLEPRSAADLP